MELSTSDSVGPAWPAGSKNPQASNATPTLKEKNKNQQMTGFTETLADISLYADYF